MGAWFDSRLESFRASIEEDIAGMDGSISARKARSKQEVKETRAEIRELEDRVTTNIPNAERKAKPSQSNHGHARPESKSLFAIHKVPVSAPGGGEVQQELMLEDP